jgi:hypothetical protein
MPIISDMKVPSLKAFPSFSTFLQEAAASPALLHLPAVVAYDRNVGRMSPEDREQAINAVYASLSPLLQNTFNELKKLLNRMVPKKGLSDPPKILMDVKTLPSLVSKVVKRGKKLSEVGDLVRCAILFGTKEEADEFVNRVRRTAQVVGYEEKKAGSDKQYGYYGSHHIDLQINGLTVEMQVMTKKLWKYKEVAHGIYNKYRDTGGKPSKDDAQWSQSIFNIANKHSGQYEDIAEHILDDIESWSDFSEGLTEITLDFPA